MKRSFFDKFWVEMPVREYVDEDNLLRSLEGIFRRYNDSRTNPYSGEEGQRIIREKGVHTSMSVEDVVKVRDTYYMVVDIGFAVIRFTKG